MEAFNNGRGFSGPQSFEIAESGGSMQGMSMEGVGDAERPNMTTPVKSKTRSLSDGGPSQLSPSPHIFESTRRTSKDDSVLASDGGGNGNTGGNNRNQQQQQQQQQHGATPVTPSRPFGFGRSGGGFGDMNLALQMPSRDLDGISPIRPPQNQNQHQQTPSSSHWPLPASLMRPAPTPTPLSPKLDHSQSYASPTSILPRRSRGLDFSRAATSLHHSTLAEQSSPESSPTIGGRGMNIPGRASADFNPEQSSNSLWSMMGRQERMNISSSVGSTAIMGSDSSSSDEEDDFMDDEMEDAIMSTPQAGFKGNQTPSHGGVVPWMPESSPAASNLSSFRSRSRPRKHPRRKGRNLLGQFNAANPAAISRSPPNPLARDFKDRSMSHSRRESISWAANQLHISATSSEERSSMDAADDIVTPSKDGQRGVVKRVVTRRGNLFPKTKGFARIRAALAEEVAPVDTEVRREAEVIRQVRDSDVDLEPRVPQNPDMGSAPGTAQSSPNMQGEPLDELADEDAMADGAGLSSSFKQQVLRNSKGNQKFWDTFSETGSVAGGSRAATTPPPPAFLPRGSSSGISEDVNMDSPSLSTGSGTTSLFGAASGTVLGPSDAQQQLQAQSSAQNTGNNNPWSVGTGGAFPPTAAEITKRLHSKRRRDDDFDPVSFKRRAVSPGMSVHGSPVTQSPLQRDMAPWGPSRPGSNHGGEPNNSGRPSGTPSESGGSTSAGPAGSNGNSARPPLNGAKGRVGFQGMVDTNDGIMRMSIE